MQWKRKKRLSFVIGSANHPLLLREYRLTSSTSSSSCHISDAGPESAAAPPLEEQEATVAPSPEHRVTFNEDEYTKITTPRQDVLFKKGYLGRRRTNNPTDAQEIHSADSVESEYIPEEQPQFAYVPPTGFIDHTGVLYVNSSTYELYDPYSGNVTVVVGPAPQYPPQPVLAAMPCQPVPLTPLEWFNPPAPWMCPYNNRRKRYSTDSQNCSAQSSESTGPPGSPQEPIDDGAGAMFPPQPPPYMYPGYMFGAPVYNMNGVNVQGVMPQPPVPVNTETPTTKRRKKRRRRRRGGVTDEGSESSCEEVTSCDVGVCSQSGASSDAGQGSTCSKTNSDSGINTEPTPDSGSNTPPPMSEVQLLPSAQNFDGTTVVEEHNYIEHQQPEIEVDLEPISSSVSTPEAHKCTFESLPSEDGETLQELSCSSESNESKLISYSSDFISCSTESNDNKSVSCLTTETDEINNTPQQMDHITTDLDSLDLKASENSVEPNSPEQSETELISCSSQLSESQFISNDVPLNLLNDNICNDETIIPSNKCNLISNEENLINVEENKEIKNVEAKNEEEIILIIDTKDVIDNNEVISKAKNNTDEELLDKDPNIKKEDNKLKTKQETPVAYEKLCNGDILRHEEYTRSEENTSEVNVPIKDSDNEIDTSSRTVEEQSVISLTTEDEISCSLNDISLNRLSLNHNDDETECKVVDEIQRPLKKVTPLNFQQFPACYEGSAPVPPPRRRRSLYRSAEKVAKKVVDEAVEEGTKEAACIKCEHALPITEAVTRWLQSQGPNVLSPNDSDEDEDEGIEDGEGSTNQKNVEGNPFLAPYLSGSRKRVADSDECGSLVSSAGEWDMYDHESHTRAICDPATSVDKYYRLGADDLDDKAPTTPSMIKTAVHIRRAGPFPCGVCCIIQ